MEEEQKNGKLPTSSSSVVNADDVTTVPVTSEAAETARDAAAASGSSSVVTSKLTGLKRKLPSASAAAALATGASTEAAVSLFDAALPPSSPAVETYRSCLLSHFFPSSSSPRPSSLSSLPGPQPASLIRAELHKLESGQYWVCEKSDGERCILLLHSGSRTVALVDRKWTCRVLRRECGALLVSLLAAKGDTVLDAELLEEDEGRGGGGDGSSAPRCRLSLFDVLAVNGERVADRLFSGVWSSGQPPVSDGSGRLDVLHNAVQAPYRDWIQKSKAADSPPAPVLLLDRCLELHVKEFEPKHRVDAIVSRISRSAAAASSSPFSHHVYSYKGRSNSNDGLIFTPDADSYYARNTPLLKWKWPDLNTVDFLITQPFTAAGDRGLPLLCLGHVRQRDSRGAAPAAGEPQVQHVVFDHIRQLDETGAAALADVRRRGATSAVVECGYSRTDSDWHIKCVRWDKSSSNFLTTVVATMKACIDDLQSADIIQACKKSKLQVRRG